MAYSPETGHVCDGRITATSGNAVTTADVAGTANVYYTPYKGNRIALYDGSSTWNTRSFSEITVSLSGATADKPYDIFAYDNAGVVTIEKLIWTNTTTRATALTTQDGVLVKNGVTTRRYLGTIYINASGGQTDDTTEKRYIWNYYHRQFRALRRVESTGTWTYTTATWRQANGAAANQVDVVIGVAETPVVLSLIVASKNSTAATSSVNVNRHAAITLDVTNAMNLDTVAVRSGMETANQMFFDINDPYVHALNMTHYPAIGRHYYAWIESATAVGTATWFGASPNSDTMQHGMSGFLYA